MSNYEETLYQADISNGSIDIIQEVLIFRTKDSLSDYFLTDNGQSFPYVGYTVDGYPFEQNIDAGKIEIIDISDIVKSYSFSEDNQFGAASANIEITNIDNLFSKDNITYLSGSKKLKSRPVDLENTHMTLDMGQQYKTYNPNYFNNDSSKFNPMFRENNIIKIREGILIDGQIEWNDRFIGLIKVVNSSLDATIGSLSFVALDFFKCLLDSSSERKYISPIKDYNGSYYYSQKHFAHLHGKAPSYKSIDFNNGFNPSYTLPSSAMNLLSLGDLRTFRTPTNIMNWSSSPKPKIYLSHNVNDLGFIVKYYNGLEPIGTPSAVVKLNSIEFDHSTGIPANSNIVSESNWCAVIETEMRYSSTGVALYSLLFEGDAEVIWNGNQIGNVQKGRIRGGEISLADGGSGVVVPLRKENQSFNQGENGLIHWKDTYDQNKKDKLRIIYKCGKSKGSDVDFISAEQPLSSSKGWRNMLALSVADSNEYPDVFNSYSYLAGKPVEEKNTDPNTSSLESGFWKEISNKSDYPDYLQIIPIYSIAEGDSPSFGFGEILTGSSSVPSPRISFELDPSDEYLGYNILYSRGWVELNQPANITSGGFTLAAKFCFKELPNINKPTSDFINNAGFTIKEIFEDIFMEDFLGVPRYLFDNSGDPEAYGVTNNIIWQYFLALKKINIKSVDSIIDNLRLDLDSTDNSFSAIQEVLKAAKGNFRIKADGKGNFNSDFLFQAGTPQIFMMEYPFINGSLSDRTGYRPVKTNPATNEITDRDFYSVSLIGWNGDQETPDIKQTNGQHATGFSHFRRESLISPEFSIDKPSARLVSNPSYRPSSSRNRLLAIRVFKNLVFRTFTERFEHKSDIDEGVNGKRFVDRISIYKRSWSGSQWSYIRYEIPTNSNIIKANALVYDASSQGQKIINIDNLSSATEEQLENILYYYVDMNYLEDGINLNTDDFNGTYVTIIDPLNDLTSVPSEEEITLRFGDATAPGQASVAKITAKAFYKETETDDYYWYHASFNPGGTMQTGFTIIGDPLIIDYDYRVSIITNLSTPVDNNDLINKVKVTGRTRFTTKSDIIEGLSSIGKTGADVIKFINGSPITTSPSEESIFSGIKGNISGTTNLGSPGFTQIYLGNTLKTYEITDFLTSYKVFPENLPDNQISSNQTAYANLYFPGILVNYAKFAGGGSFLGYPDQILNAGPVGGFSNGTVTPQGASEIRRAYDTFANGLGNFALTTNQVELSGEDSARLFSFRFNVPEVGAAYEFEFKVDDLIYYRIDAGLWKRAYRNGLGGVDGDRYFRIQATNKFVNFEIYYANAGGDDGSLSIKYKKRPYVNAGTLDPGGAWDSVASQPLPLNALYAGLEPISIGFTGGHILNAVKIRSIDYPTRQYTRDYVSYSYGKQKTFLYSRDYFPVRRGPFDEVGSFDVANLYPLKPDASYALTIVPSNPSGFDKLIIGDYNGNPDVAFASPVLEIISGEEFPPVFNPNSNSTPPTYSSISDETNGFDLFVLDLQAERNIGEIGLLVGLGPRILDLDGVDQIEVSHTLINQEFMHILGPRDQNASDELTRNYMSMVYKETDSEPTDASIETLNDTGNSGAVAPGEFEVTYNKTTPQPISPNDEVSYEIRIESKKDVSDPLDENGWSLLVDWQDVYTRSEIFKFNFDELTESEFRYLRIKARKVNSSIYQSFPIELGLNVSGIDGTSEEIKSSILDKGLLTGPTVRISGRESGNYYVKQVFLGKPSEKDIKIIHIGKIYILEKEEVSSIVYAETEKTNKWYNPFMKDEYSFIVDQDGNTSNKKTKTKTVSFAGTKAECMNQALIELGDNIASKDNISLDLTYSPRLRSGSTVWVQYGVMGGNLGSVGSGRNYFNLNPGKLLLVEQLNVSKNATVPSLNATLRNYR